MLYNFKRRVCTRLLAVGAVCLAGLAMFSCSDEYNLDEEQPSGLNTIYGYMEKKGNFTNFLQIIDDLGEAEVLSKTGSKTVFPADDDAFAEFYASNDWGVTKYSDLTTAQKKLLLYSAMIDNPYPTSMLSTAEGPVKGEVCRRMSSLSLFDSVQVVSTTSDELPQTSFWSVLQSTHPEIVLFKDASGSQPMIHFTPKFISATKLESTDIDFLYNDPAGTRQSDDTYVNDAKIVESQFCKNGFIHIVDHVITPLDNMAEIIRKNSNMSFFSEILERFAVPKDSSALTKAYNENKGTDVDTVYVKRYFSDRSWGSGTTEATRVPLVYDKDGNTFDASLKYDPGWNTFLPEIFNNRNGMMEDMGVMLVPSDEAMTDWWNNGGGGVIRDAFGSLENTPNSVLAELINVNMLNSLTSSVPSRFSSILNDANLEMGVTEDDIEHVYLGCNGVVYLTNKVFAPASYSSVLFPAVIDTENLNIIKNAIDNLEYDAYLNSMVSTYSFFIPTNDGMLRYIDPVSYGQSQTLLWEFHYDDSKAQAARIYADVYRVNTDTWEIEGEKVKTITGGTGNAQIKNRLEDILDNIIGVEEVYDGKTYVITKGKTFVKCGGTINSEGSMTAAGSFQDEIGNELTVNGIYRMDNGYAYVVDGILMGTRNAVSDVLAENDEFQLFYQVLAESNSFAITDGTYCSASQNSTTSQNATRGNLVTVGTNSSGKETYYSLLNAFHYTVYAPTNDAMEIAFKAGLPTLEQLQAAEEYDAANAEAAETDDSVEETDSADHIRSIYRDFIRYHVQTNSIYLDNGFDTGTYESTKTQLEYQKNEDGTISQNSDGSYNVIAGSPYRITVNSVSPSGMTLTDHKGNTVNVVTSGGLYNLQAREYWLNGTNVEKATTIENSSSVVVHAIDRPLLYDDDQFIYVSRKVITDESVKQRK